MVAAAAGALYWYKNDGRGRFDAGTLIAGVTDAVFALGDLNGDGKLDLVTGAKWYSGDDAGVFTDAGTVDSGTVGAIAVGDIDGDGKLDVVVTGAGRATTAYRNLAGTGVLDRAAGRRDRRRDARRGRRRRRRHAGRHRRQRALHRRAPTQRDVRRSPSRPGRSPRSPRRRSPASRSATSTATAASTWSTAHGTQATRVQLGTGTLAFAAGATLGSVALKVDQGPYLKVTGTAITLDIAGQKLTGTFSFERSGAARPPRRLRHARSRWPTARSC